MAPIEKFEDMDVWQHARVMAKSIYSISGEGNFFKDYGLKDQIQRAAVSVMSNIAEGFERGSNKEFIQFLFIAKGSAGEIRSQLYVAFDLGYIPENKFKKLNTEVLVISQQLSGFIKYLKESKMTGPKR
ncbi:MAG: four helix bundle protein [Desulfobacteraceae bacterium]|jgi:four helix bundle protein